LNREGPGTLSTLWDKPARVPTPNDHCSNTVLLFIVLSSSTILQGSQGLTLCLPKKKKRREKKERERERERERREKAGRGTVQSSLKNRSINN
jgi:hypothetical protein